MLNVYYYTQSVECEVLSRRRLERKWPVGHCGPCSDSTEAVILLFGLHWDISKTLSLQAPAEPFPEAGGAVSPLHALPEGCLFLFHALTFVQLSCGAAMAS